MIDDMDNTERTTLNEVRRRIERLEFLCSRLSRKTRSGFRCFDYADSIVLRSNEKSHLL